MLSSPARPWREVSDVTEFEAKNAAGGAGLGEGGGLYLAADGEACLDASTQVQMTGNQTSTSDADIFGAFTTCP
jgi:hypothetical protein